MKVALKYYKAIWYKMRITFRNYLVILIYYMLYRALNEGNFLINFFIKLVCKL